MNSLDIHNLIERAKTSAKELGIDSDVSPPEISEIDSLTKRAEDLVQQEEHDIELQKRAAAARAQNLVIAKLLAAADVFTEVSR